MAKRTVKVNGVEFVVDDELLYTPTHEWVRVEEGKVRVGITDYAQKQMKDIVGVALPEVGDHFNKGDEVATVESMKAAEAVYAPVTGEIVEVNERLLEEPELINRDPYGDGWIFVMTVEKEDDLKELLDHEKYIEKVREEIGEA